MTLVDLLATLAVAVGIFFVAIGALGFLRLPDIFCRLHVTGVMDTLGAPLIMLGAAISLGPRLVSLKLLFGIVFLVATSPLLGHLLARAALEAGLKPRVIEDDTGSGSAEPREGGRG
jgi:multicomponent Na+:H+ antiporter subunit G